MPPSNVTIKRETAPTDALIESAVDICVKLMSEDPLARVFAGGDINNFPAMCRAAYRAMAYISGEFYTATDENGSLIAFTLWTPPGKHMWDTEEQRQLGFYDFMSLVSDEGKAFLATDLSKGPPQFYDQSTGIPQVEVATYWCRMAMVKAEYQGKGICKALFELVYEKAKETGVPMALSTTAPVNVEIYKKLGFQLKGHEVFKSPWGDWSEWVMLCETKESA